MRGTDLREEMARRGGQGRGTGEIKEDILSRWLRDRSREARREKACRSSVQTNRREWSEDTWKRGGRYLLCLH